MKQHHVLIVAQPFKETLSSAVVADAMANGVRRAGGHPLVTLGSDGGDGLLDALGDRLLDREEIRVTGPRGEDLFAEFGWLEGNTAVIESRLICGLGLVPAGQRDPLRSTSRGVGEAIVAAISAGAEEIVVGLGGSAMVDGGWGMATVFGWVFEDESGTALKPGADSFLSIRACRAGRLPTIRPVALCDVDVPFRGRGGAVVFARQKGVAEAGLSAIPSAIAEFTGLEPSWAVIGDAPGSGAAGGLGFGLAAFLGAVLKPGAEWVMERAGFEDLIPDAVLVVTGEGRFDRTSLLGKLVGTVLRRAADRGVPAVVLAPSCAPEMADLPGVEIVSGGGVWGTEDISLRTEQVVREQLRLLGS